MSTAAAPPQRHHTFWCHECYMSVILLHPPPTNPRCPQCYSDFLEQMDPFAPTPFPQFQNHPNPSSVIVPRTTFTPSDDNFLLDSPYFHRLIHQLTTTNDAPTANRHHNPASRSAVAALEVIQISSSMLENDPIIPCAVCKDQFLLDMQVKMLPCKHMYHSDCILPWLEMNNSCPVCRFRLPTEEDEDCHSGDNFTAAMRLEGLLGEQEGLFGSRRTLRRVARRHQLDREDPTGGDSLELRRIARRRHQLGREDPTGGDRLELRRVARRQQLDREDPTGGDSLEFQHSSTQIGQVGEGIGVVTRASSVETVSSWPNWLVEGGSEDEVGASGYRFGG